MRVPALMLCGLLLAATVGAKEEEPEIRLQEEDDGCAEDDACSEEEEEEEGDAAGSSEGGERTVAEPPEHDITPPDTLPAGQVEDTTGNYKLSYPAGWEVARGAPESGDDVDRIVLLRKDRLENVIAALYVFRFTSSRAETFSLDTPSDVLSNIQKNGMFDGIFGDGAGDRLQPKVDEAVGLGGAEKSGSYEFRGIKTEEEKEIREKEALQRRGEKIEIPTFQPIAVRGRLALLSPNVYFVRCEFARIVADHPGLGAEFKQVMDSWEFLTAGALPAPLSVLGEQVGDTTADPANTEAKKQRFVYAEAARKKHEIEVGYTRPKGFVVKQNPNGNPCVLAYAQDARNNWIQVMVINASFKRVGEQNKVFQDKKEVFETWATNWESKARGVKVPRKPQKFNLGKVSGQGYKLLRGKVEGFVGTWQGVLQDKSSWRTMVEIETRGRGYEVFAKELEVFLKSLDLKPR